MIGGMGRGEGGKEGKWDRRGRKENEKVQLCSLCVLNSEHLPSYLAEGFHKTQPHVSESSSPHFYKTGDKR